MMGKATFILLAAVLGSSAWGAETGTVDQLITETEQTMSRLGAPLELTPDEVVYLQQAAMQLTDSRTGMPYETVGHHALPYYVLDSSQPATPQKQRTVLFIGGIHADEVAPMVTAWRTLLSLEERKDAIDAGIRLVYAPLTNPDGILTETALHGFPTRENLHGVDLNRNFSHGSPEQETRFLMDLIKDFDPELIVSLHAPYDWLDYDGPAKIHGASNELKQSVQDWLKAIQATAAEHIGINNNFEIYPGSLGQYAGFGLKIHVLTFEYPTKEASHGQSDYKLLGPSLLRSLDPP